MAWLWTLHCQASFTMGQELKTIIEIKWNWSFGDCQDQYTLRIHCWKGDASSHSLLWSTFNAFIHSWRCDIEIQFCQISVCISINYPGQQVFLARYNYGHSLCCINSHTPKALWPWQQQAINFKRAPQKSATINPVLFYFSRGAHSELEEALLYPSKRWLLFWLQS